MNFTPGNTDPIEEEEPLGLTLYQERSLLTLLLCVGIAGPLVSVSLYLREGLTPLTWVAIALTAVVLTLLALYLNGLRRLVAKVLVYVLILASALAIAAQGSVRSMGSMVMLAAVVGAGAFLHRRHMFVAAGLSIGLLGALNLAENTGVLKSSLGGTGWVVWITQTVVLISLTATVSLGRHRMINAHRSQHLALEHAREVERLLRMSQARFQALFRSTPAACLVQSLDTLDVIDANEAFQSLFGYPQSELIGQRPPRLWADKSEHLRFRHAIDTRGRVENLRVRAKRQDGSEFHASVYAEVTDSGSEKLLIAVIIDVSAEVISRHELEQSRDRFSKAFNFSPLGMTITRLRDGMFVEVNPSNERILGWTQADFIGKTSTEVGVWVSEVDRQRYVSSLQRDGRLIAHETRMRTKSGAVVDVRVWAEIIEIDGDPCALSFTLNVADEKRREAMLLNVAKGVSGETGEAFFLSLVEHLANAIGADGVMVGEVDAGRQLDTLALIWDGQLQPNVSKRLNNTMCEQALQQPELFRFNSPDITHMPLVPPFDSAGLHDFVGLPLRDADGSVVGLVTAVWREAPAQDSQIDALMTIFASRCNAELLRLRRDREIRKLHDTLEQRVVARTAQLQYLNRELDAFAYTVSHDLKSPLRSIDGFNHLLREQMADRITPDDAMLFERVDASVQRMNRLITDLLALARVSQGTLQRMHTDISELAQDVIRQEQHRDPARQVRVEIEGGLIADCDPRLAHIVLENLLGNAWKYTRHTADPCIRLRQVQAANGGSAVFCVEDNGAGFDPSRADRLFKAFTRLHASNEFEGSGIGLATVRRILERHGGHIRGEGAVGQGARFEFSFGSGALH